MKKITVLLSASNTVNIDGSTTGYIPERIVLSGGAGYEQQPPFIRIWGGGKTVLVSLDRVVKLEVEE